MISDAAFKKEELDGHSMRGAAYVRCPGNAYEDFTNKDCVDHLLEWVARQQRRVTRSTFTSELLGGCDTLDKGLLYQLCLEHIASGETSAMTGWKRSQEGGWKVPCALYLDAMSVTAAITATFVKIPADNSAYMQCLYIRELLEHGVLGALVWQDTRDMVADGLTKGAIEREALHKLMAGLCQATHEMKAWRPTTKSSLLALRK